MTDSLTDIEKLKIWTSCSTEERFNELVEKNILPIIIIGITKNSPLSKWRNTMIHFIDLGPDQDLWKEYKSNQISRESFKEKYLHYLWKNSDIFYTLEKFDILMHLSRASGICILGGTSNNIEDDPTRETIMDYLNTLNLGNKVEEWKS